MRCVSFSSTKTAHRCALESMCGRQATVPAHHWPPIESTCWLPGDWSALMVHGTGYCCPTLVMPGPGVLQRTAEFAWLPGVVQSKPPELHQALVLVSCDSGKSPARIF